MILITSGCSFSKSIPPHHHTWPSHVQKYLDCEHRDCAMGSQGNGIIMRRLLYECNLALKENKSDELLIGVMWSGPDRFDFYSERHGKLVNKDNWMVNPVSFMPEDPGGWVILNYGWKMEDSKAWYGRFHNPIYAQWLTLEYILQVQNYLKLHDIRYFMMTYTDKVLPESVCCDDRLRWMYEQIDFNKFVGDQGCYEWCRDHSGLEFPVPGDNHPSTEQHEAYAQKVIIPYLVENNLI